MRPSQALGYVRRCAFRTETDRQGIWKIIASLRSGRSRSRDTFDAAAQVESIVSAYLRAAMVKVTPGFPSVVTYTIATHTSEDASHLTGS